MPLIHKEHNSIHSTFNTCKDWGIMKGTFVRKAAAVFAGIGVAASTVVFAAPAQAGVVLYDGYNYSGAYRDFGVGYVTYVGAEWNDRAGSLSVSSPATYTTVYENLNYGGASKSFSTGSPDLRAWTMKPGYNWDNEISSLY
jgi:hypothetical protein